MKYVIIDLFNPSVLLFLRVNQSSAMSLELARYCQTGGSTLTSQEGLHIPVEASYLCQFLDLYLSIIRHKG